MGTTAETLTQPSVQAQELIVELLVDSEQRTYEYTHADGTVHHAENAESARAACPVLGKMAVEQADLLLEVAALGQQKMAEQQVKEQSQQPEIVKPSKAEPERAKTKDVVQEKSAASLNIKPLPEVIQEVVQAEKQPPLTVVPKPTTQDVTKIRVKTVTADRRDTVIEPKTASISIGVRKVRYAEQQPRETFEQRSNSRDEPTVKKRTEQLPATFDNESLVIEDFNVEAVTTPLERIPHRVEEVVDLDKTKAVTAFGLDNTEPNNEPVGDDMLLSHAVITETTTIAEPEQPAAVRIGADELLELYFEPEVINTYEERLNLIEGSSIEAPEQLEDTENINVADVVINEPVVAPILQQATEHEAESFSTSEPIPEEIMPLETTAEWAKEYLLEETQVQKLEITPEITHKSLSLLHILGYEYPKEALTDFVRVHGLAFLLQPIRYMYEMGSIDDRKELLSISTPTPSSDSNPRSRLGGLILRLITAKGLVLHNSTS